MRETFNEGFTYGTKDAGPITDQLHNKRVVAFLRRGDGSVVVEECCDHAFAVILTAEEFSQLLEELKRL